LKYHIFVAEMYFMLSFTWQFHAGQKKPLHQFHAGQKKSLHQPDSQHNLSFALLQGKKPHQGKLSVSLLHLLSMAKLQQGE
jgi:hypothetical protein